MTLTRRHSNLTEHHGARAGPVQCNGSFAADATMPQGLEPLAPDRNQRNGPPTPLRRARALPPPSGPGRVGLSQPCSARARRRWAARRRRSLSPSGFPAAAWATQPDSKAASLRASDSHGHRAQPGSSEFSAISQVSTFLGVVGGEIAGPRVPAVGCIRSSAVSS